MKPLHSPSKYVRRVAHTLRLRGPLAADPTARMLHGLLLVLAIWIALALFTLPLAPVTRIRIFSVFVPETSLVGALIFVRLGHFRSASVIYLAGTWIWATYVVALSGGIRSPGLVLYVTLPISAAWLLGYRAALWTAGGSLVTGLVFAYLDLIHVNFPVSILVTSGGIWFAFVQATLIGTIPVGQVLRTLLDTLEQLQREVTERERREQALRESEERFRRMADTAPVMIVVSDKEQLATFFNKGWLDFTGRTMEQELGNGWATGVHPDDLDRCLATYSSSFDARRSFRMEYRLRRADGEYRWVLDTGVPLYRGGEFSGYIGSCIDVTEQELAQDRLRASERRLIESEERLKSAQRLAHVGNWVWDIKADHVFWSEELYRIFGWPPNYSPDYQGLLQAVQPQDRERVDRSVTDSLAGKKSPDLLEFQITRPDGEVRTVACISEVLRDGAGSPVRMSGACQDVTDQRRAEAASQKSRDEIAHLNRVAAMGELTASLAHELKQPLAAILINAQAAGRFLNRESPDLAQARECLTDIVADDKRAGEVIQTLRTLLRKGESQASLVDLNEVVSNVIRLLGTDAMRRHASVKFEPLPALRPVLGDRTQLHQVVLNLIMNGLEATAERPPDNRWVLVRTAEAEGGGVELTVEDSGKGIDEGDLARVFEPFYTTKREGLGMGLSISRSIVEANGGRILAENSAGHGAIFRCMLRLAQQGAAAAVGLATPPHSASTREAGGSESP